jgi:hypothetical protein
LTQFVLESQTVAADGHQRQKIGYQIDREGVRHRGVPTFEHRQLLVTEDRHFDWLTAAI